MATTKQKAGVAGGGVAAGVAIALALIQPWEGKRNDPYLDIVRVATVCYGHTGDVDMGRRYSDEECRSILKKDVATHTAPILKCVPGLADRPYQLGAAASLAFNIGPKGFCGSTAARRFNAGNWRGGCDAFLFWNKAGGRVVKGLANRRRAEWKVCVTDLPS